MADFNQGLLGCFDNTSLCIIACFAPPFVYGKTAEKYGENPALWAIGYLFAGPCVGALLRGVIRRKHGIEGSFFSDCLIHSIFGACAVIQEAAQDGSINYLIDQPEPQDMGRTPAS